MHSDPSDISIRLTEQPTGLALRARRRALGMDLHAASFASGVRAEHIKAIEEGDLSALPTLGYALGYVRAYARVLELEPDAVVADFKSDISAPRQLDRRGVPHFVPTRRLRLPKGSVPALGVIAAVVMLGTWYGVQLDTVAAPGSPGAPALQPGETVASEPVSDSVVSLVATAPSWMSIRNSSGTLVANRVFVTGERFEAARGQDLSVTVRDGGAVELRIGERSLGPLGKPGEPVTGFALGGVD